MSPNRRGPDIFLFAGAGTDSRLHAKTQYVKIHVNFCNLPGNWFESSDTVRQPGMSKATFTLQQLNKEVRNVSFKDFKWYLYYF